MIPASNANLKKFTDQLFATKNVAEWTYAAVIYAWTTDEAFEANVRLINGFAHAGVRGFSHPSKVRAYREAYEVAVSEGIVQPVSKGDEFTVPTIDFGNYLESTQWKIKARAQAKTKAKSRQQENLERDGHKPNSPKPTPTSKRQDRGPRVSTVRERGERIVQELRAQVKQEQDVGRKAIWEATLSVALNALNSYTKAGV